MNLSSVEKGLAIAVVGIASGLFIQKHFSGQTSNALAYYRCLDHMYVKTGSVTEKDREGCSDIYHYKPGETR